MSPSFAAIAFTDSVKAAQERAGSRSAYARAAGRGDPLNAHLLSADEVKFIENQRSFYMASVSETGWPYVQHRGGAPGFLKVVNPGRLAFGDYGGNRQFVTVGNLAGDSRVALILMDYVNRVRLKILGRAYVSEAPSHLELVTNPGYRTKPERAFLVDVAAFDWNCPQHIPIRFEADDVRRALAERDARIVDLEQRLSGASPEAPSN